MTTELPRFTPAAPGSIGQYQFSPNQTTVLKLDHVRPFVVSGSELRNVMGKWWAMDGWLLLYVASQVLL